MKAVGLDRRIHQPGANAANRRRAHQLLERGRTIGELVLDELDQGNA